MASLLQYFAIAIAIGVTLANWIHHTIPYTIRMPEDYENIQQ